MYSPAIFTHFECDFLIFKLKKKTLNGWVSSILLLRTLLKALTYFVFRLYYFLNHNRAYIRSYSTFLEKELLFEKLANKFISLTFYKN